MEKLSEIEKELIKLGGSDATNRTESHSKASDKGGKQISTNISEKNALSVKSGHTSGTHQGDHATQHHVAANLAKYAHSCSSL